MKSSPIEGAEKGAAKKSKSIAIVGMSCLFPGAPDLGSFWSNIVGAVDATREVTDREWPASEYYDPDGQSKGLSYSKRGGFISEYADFDPLKFGIMPSAVSGSDADQFLTLKVAAAAMADAGYDWSAADNKLNRDRAEIILGRISAPGAGSINLIQQSKTAREIESILRAVLPDQAPEAVNAIVDQVRSKMVACTADNAPGAMPNVLAGRVASKLGFRGRNMLVDAACASSMVAVETAVNDLLDHRCDFALAGGVHINASAVFFQMFCILGALSHKDIIRPFDQDADGTILGEGIGILCLKRYEEAVADGDRIYATIAAVASSSDGHGGSVLAPSLEGEALAMRRAYEIAGISPSTVQLLEAHGTGTPVGDVVELEAVAKVFKDGTAGAEPWCALGSVKSMIGHCQSASAVAGIIKATLALHHKILPPTLHVTKPNNKIDWAFHPCYVNSQTRPWIIAGDSPTPRRAAVSAFGFGGINGHMILEEFSPASAIAAAAATSAPTSASVVALPGASAGTSASASATETASARSSAAVPATTSTSASATTVQARPDASMHAFDSEVFTFLGASKEALLKSISELRQYIEVHPGASLMDLAYTVNCVPSKERSATGDDGGGGRAPLRLALVASSVSVLVDKLDFSLELVSGRAQGGDKDVYFTEPDALVGGKLAFLYPGLGSAYTNMLADLCMYFPEVREVFEIVDSVAMAAGAAQAPSKSIFPPPFDKGARAVPTLLGAADFAVVAVLLAEYSMYQLLMHLGIKPDVIMGCSTGEFAAITTMGSVDVLSVAKNFYQLSTRVARSIPEEKLADLSTLRVLSSWSRVSKLADGDLYLSADLGDDHIIVTGAKAVIFRLSDRLKESRIGSHPLPVPIPYHTPLVASIIDANHEAVRSVDIQPLLTPGWSCSTASLYPDDVEEMRSSFVELFTKPIALRQTVQAMYEDGVRTFVEVGPNGILTSAIGGILKGLPHVAVPSNLASRSGLTQIHHLLAVLHTQAVPADLEFLYKRRDAGALDFSSGATVAGRTSSKLLTVTHAPLRVDESALREILKSARRSDQNFLDEHAGDQNDDCDAGELCDEDERLEEAGEELTGSDDQVIQSFLNTNASFYNRLNSITQNVMQSYLAGNGEFAGDGDNPEGSGALEGGAVEQNLLPENDVYGGDFSDLSFLRTARIDYQNDQTAVFFNLDLTRHRYLLDHAIGGTVSTAQNTRVHLVPLMVTLELMAQAAFAHIQQGVPVRIEQVKAFRRIVVDHLGLTLKAQAAGDGDQIKVVLSDAGDSSVVYATADFVFADQYQDSQQAGVVPQLAVNGGKAPERLKDTGALYGTEPLTMFHGPLMQSVLDIYKVGNRAITGTADGRQASGWTGTSAEEKFLLHPLLLDNASQFVLFYLYENSLSATALLPFFIESIDFFKPAQERLAEVRVTAALPTLTERATEASLEILAGDKMVLRINGINSRRVILSSAWEKFVADPLHSYLCASVGMDRSLTGPGAIMLARQSILPDDEAIVEWCLDYLLTRGEQAVWRDTSKTKKRKLDWLLGRIAAKEAVRKLIFEVSGRVLGPHDVEIFNHINGVPLVLVADRNLPEIVVSISHTEGVAVALAVPHGAASPGIDAEIVRQREPSFASTFLHPHELDHLAGCPRESVNLELTRLWSAKEALFKSCGGAFEMSSFALAAESSGPDVLVMTGGQPVQKKRAYTAAQSDLVIAYVV